jgi:hypothetical protein
MADKGEGFQAQLALQVLDVLIQADPGRYRGAQTSYRTT